MQINLFSCDLLGLWISFRAQLCQHKLDRRVFVGASHGLVHEASIDLVDSHSKWACVVFIQSELCHAEVLYFVLVSQKVVELVLVIVAYRCDVEEFDVVFECNPEAPIVDVL